MNSPLETFTILDVAYRGNGIAKDNGIVTFIPGTLPGEVVTAKITVTKKRFREAELASIITPSPNRIEPCCRLSDGTRIPGCVYDHVDYPAELSLKNGQLQNFLTRISPTAFHFLPPFAAPSPLNYRNKIVLHVQRSPKSPLANIGYLGDDNHTVIDIPSCPLAHPAINFAWARMRDHARKTLADGETITFRHTETDGVVSWVGPTPENATWLTEKTLVGDLTLPPDGFFQVNPTVAGTLVRQVQSWLSELRAQEEISSLLDLYCGIGIFAFAAASIGIQNITAVESGRRAINAAKRNARNLRLNVRFFCNTVAQAATDTHFYDTPLQNATVIVDPPRQGLEPKTTQFLASSPIRNLIYVSCDPATLSRDLTQFLAAGFIIKEVRLFDMFPRTLHFETAVLLTR